MAKLTTRTDVLLGINLVIQYHVHGKAFSTIAGGRSHTGLTVVCETKWSETKRNENL